MRLRSMAVEPKGQMDRTRPRLAALLMALTTMLLLAVAGPTLGASGAVTIQDFKFGPDRITVSVGDSITWTNEDSVGHTATARDGSFNTRLIQSGDSATVTFSTAGTFSYFCSPHPQMVGSVVVLAAPATDTAPAAEPSRGTDPVVRLLLLGAAAAVGFTAFRLRLRRSS